MNKCMFMGNLTKDPVLRHVDNIKKTSVVNFSIAINRSFKDNQGQFKRETSYADCEAWDTAAELIAEKYKKGDAILITDAMLRTDKWTDKEGNQRSRTKFRVNSFEPLPKPRREKDQNNNETLEKYEENLEQLVSS